MTHGLELEKADVPILNVRYRGAQTEQDVNALREKARELSDKDIPFWDAIYIALAWLEGIGAHPDDYAPDEDESPTRTALQVTADAFYSRMMRRAEAGDQEAAQALRGLTSAETTRYIAQDGGSRLVTTEDYKVAGLEPAVDPDWIKVNHDDDGAGEGRGRRPQRPASRN